MGANIAFIAKKPGIVDEIRKQIEAKEIININVLPPGADTSKYEYVEYDVEPNKEYAEILDLGQCVSTLGFVEEPLPMVEKGDKGTLIKEMMKRERKIITDMVDEEPTEVTLDLVLEELKEIERKRNQIGQMKVDELLRLYDQTFDIRQNLVIANEIAKRVNRGWVKESSIEWILEPWEETLQNLQPYMVPQLTKAFRTRAKNILKDGKKLASLRYFHDWLLENNPWLGSGIHVRHEDRGDAYEDYEVSDFGLTDETIPF